MGLVDGLLMCCFHDGTLFYEVISCFFHVATWCDMRLLSMPLGGLQLENPQCVAGTCWILQNDVLPLMQKLMHCIRYFLHLLRLKRALSTSHASIVVGGFAWGRDQHGTQNRWANGEQINTNGSKLRPRPRRGLWSSLAEKSVLWMVVSCFQMGLLRFYLLSSYILLSLTRSYFVLPYLVLWCFMSWCFVWVSNHLFQRRLPEKVYGSHGGHRKVLVWFRTKSELNLWHKNDNGL